MAEEKILKDEILSDEQLDQVAGGSDWEIHDDANRLRGLHRLGYGPVSSDEVNDAMWRLGQDLGDRKYLEGIRGIGNSADGRHCPRTRQGNHQRRI